MQRIAVIDYGMGNLHSVAKAIEHVAPTDEVLITHNVDVIASSDRVVLPGVGAMRDCMAEIRRLGVDKTVAQVITEKPLLGICVGMQALMQYSSENGGVDCLAHFDGEVKTFAAQPTLTEQGLKIPHMGWNHVQQADHPLWFGIEDQTRFYFVHSYFVRMHDESAVAATCHYGVEFTAAVLKSNVFGVQFHPEKSHTSGLQLLKNFVQWQGDC